MKLPLRKKLEEVCQSCGIEEEIIRQFLQEDWIHPIDQEHNIFDDEDIARIALISELREDFGINDEAIPVILHLIDQLNLLHRKIQRS
jgi:chaperone modulatory protein CbpM